ncbi:MAG TPA: glycogen debranching N-terminal domain-containing protein [Dehalococcoidia bacterium]|nr:glycogen debranching N-terminal domain-containing protein [Dehalococcoidia bacterium]
MVMHPVPPERSEAAPPHRGGEPLDIDTIGDALVAKEGDVFLFTDESGEIRPDDRAGFGLYRGNTRYLSEYRLLLQGQAAIALLSTAANSFESEQVMTNRRLRGKRGRIAAPQTLQVRRRRVVDGGLLERLELSNYGVEPLSIELTLRIAADFADIFEVRGLEGVQRGRRQDTIVNRASVLFRYESLDGLSLSTELAFDPPPAEVTADHVRYVLELSPHVTHVIEVAVRVDRRATPGLDYASARLHDEYREWRRRPARITVEGNETFAAAIGRAFDDLRMLTRQTDGYALLGAGTPWYDDLFGRDSVVASLQVLPYRPEIARNTLRLLAKYQGQEVVPEREEQPGKILHELRGGELARTGQVPFGRYYGSIDSTPLFLILYSEYLLWTGDDELAQELAPNVESALAWVDRYGDPDGDGYLEYQSSAEGGLVNQGWKDSHDGIIDENGAILDAPIALVEVQAYVYAALNGLARVAGKWSSRERRDVLMERAATLQRRFTRDFWLGRERFLALALDGAKRPSRAIASNAGHALWGGILQQAPGDVVARRLFSPELFSGWGIRTLATSSPRYNPMGYHLGTVWPHDNSLIGMGLKRYGHDHLLIQLTSALFDAAQGFPYVRLPELFCGNERAEHSPPVPYPVACRPQAWGAGTIPYFVQALLGLVPDASERTLFLVRPTLPPWLTSLMIEDIHVGEGSGNLLIQRRFDRTEVKVIGADNLNVEVVSEWPRP